MVVLGTFYFSITVIILTLMAVYINSILGLGFVYINCIINSKAVFN